jgi:hypothetical protein
VFGRILGAMGPIAPRRSPALVCAFTLLAACGAEDPPKGPLTAEALCAELGKSPGPYPAPDAFEPNAGPGGPSTTFTAEEVFEECAALAIPEDTVEHRNLVTMYDGYLLMPWAPEWSGGGLTFFRFDEPCSPSIVGTGLSPLIRESHSIGFSSIGGRYAVTDMLQLAITVPNGGILFWDVSDPEAPEAVHAHHLEGHFYPDAYARVTLSVFWQAPYVFAGSADNGVHIVDASDPRSPVDVALYQVDPIVRVGQVQAVGNLLVVTAAEGARTLLVDISDPRRPQPIPGGDFMATDGDGVQRDAYFTNFANGYVYYARKSSGGGIIVWDVRDPQNPTYAGDLASNGNGGYVFVHHELAFVGESHFAAIYDLADLDQIEEVARLHLAGDLDTATPVGNVVVLSVDDDAEPGRGSVVVPFQAEPDTRAPSVTFVYPPDGADELALTSRFGVSFDEMVDVKSVFEGSVRLYERGRDPDETRVPGVASAQEALVNFHPYCELLPETEYTLEIPAGGVRDVSGNAIESTFTAHFKTGR